MKGALLMLNIMRSYENKSRLVRKRIRYYVLIGLHLSLLISCVLHYGCQPERKTEIRIGLITSLTGDYAYHGQSAVQSAMLAVKELNEAGGFVINGQNHKAVLFVEDNKDMPDVAVNAGRRLIYQENVVALVGPSISRNAIPVATLAEKVHVPMISPLSTNPATTARKQYVFRVAFVDNFQGSVLARFAYTDLGARKAAVLYDVAHAYNKGIAKVFRQVFEEVGGRVVAFETYTTDEYQDFNPQLERIRDREPDLLFLPNYTNHASLQAKCARQLGIDATIIGSDGWDESILENKVEFEGSFFSSHWHPDFANAQSKTFVNKFRRKYGRTPESEAALTYDAFGLLFHAIESQKQADPGSIRLGLSRIQSYDGVSGPIAYVGTGDPIKSVFILQVKEGRFWIYKIFDPRPSEDGQSQRIQK